jgi:hypothetical protein
MSYGWVLNEDVTNVEVFLYQSKQQSSENASSSLDNGKETKEGKLIHNMLQYVEYWLILSWQKVSLSKRSGSNWKVQRCRRDNRHRTHPLYMEVP